MSKSIAFIMLLLFACVASGGFAQADTTTIEDAEILVNGEAIGSSALPESEFSLDIVEVENETDAEAQPIPEPASVILLLAFTGILLIVGRVRRVWIR